MRKLLVIVILFISTELVIRISHPYQNRLEKILNLLQQDSMLIWKQKPNLNILFEGAAVRTNSRGFRANNEFLLPKVDNIIRIVCLGASPTFGWGVNSEDTYSQELEKELKDAYPKYNFEVINAGVIGYSSYQGMLLLKNNILRLSPDIITVAYVINDVDRYRFFRSNGNPDKELSPLNPAIIFVKNTFNKSKLYAFLQKGMMIINKNKKIIFDIGRDVKLPPARVSIDDYKNNLEEIINIARKSKIKLFFVKMPVNLPLPPYVDEASKQKAQNYVALARDSIKQGQFKEAIPRLQEAIFSDPYSPEAYFYQGVCYNMLQGYDSAEESFRRAKDFMAFRCKLDSEEYNRVMQETAGAYLVPLVDIVLKFKEYAAEQLFVDPKFDPIHPNKLGHRIIAREILNVMKQYNKEVGLEKRIADKK